MSAREFSIEDQNADLSEADIAGLRWRAIEAANSAEGLTAVERRVLVAMISVMDNKTRECRPSELWLAEFLGVNLTSVKKAKAALRDKHKLITWQKPGGPRHQSYYLFGWQKIIRLSDEAKVRAREAVDARRASKPSYGSAQTTYPRPAKGSPQATNAYGSPQATNDVTRDTPKVASTHSQGSQIDAQGSLQATPKVVPRLPDQPLISPYRSAQQSTPSAVAAAPDGRAPSAGAPHQTDTPSPGIGEVGCEEGSLPPVRSFPYPKLLEAFDDRPDLQDALWRLDAGRQSDASRILARMGKDAVIMFLERAAA